jgi:MmoB/DmpM family protein
MTPALVGVELACGAEADAVAAAALESGSDVRVTRLPALVLVEAPGRLEIDPERVRSHLGRADWEVDDLQLIMASYFGFIGRWDSGGVTLEWLGPATE